jgi:hypothetical protein
MIIMMRFMVKFLNFHTIQVNHIILKAFSRSFQYVLDLSYGDHREVLGKKEEAGKEQTESSQVKSYLPYGRAIVNRPGRRKVIPV